MDVGKRKSTTRIGVVPGSIWESRMIVDQVKGGIKVFNAEEHTSESVLELSENGVRVSCRPNKRGNRKTWSPEKFDGIKDFDEKGILKSPTHVRMKSDLEIEQTPVQVRKTRPKWGSFESNKISIHQSDMTRSEYGKSDWSEEEIEKKSFLIQTVVDESETYRHLGACQDKSITPSLENENNREQDLKQGKSIAPSLENGNYKDQGEKHLEESWDDIEVKMHQNQHYDIKGINMVENDEARRGIAGGEKRMNQEGRKSALPISPTNPKEIHETNRNLQNSVDLVMWKNVPKSSLVFGVGTFAIVSSSYVQDFNISFISIMSHLGLLYLAAIFLYKSIICRSAIDVQFTRSDHMVVGEEAIGLLKLLLPYIDELLFKLKCLFSGDPAATVKMAVLLFILARCGRFITIWNMVKLGFFVAFTVPKLYSLYFFPLTRYGEYLVQHFRDVWDSCSHKQAIAGLILTLVWILCCCSHLDRG